jgi:hypothetical protein
VFRFGTAVGGLMIRFLISILMSLGVLLTLACSKFSFQSQFSDNSVLVSPTIFEKSISLTDGDFYALDINQKESMDYDLTVGQTAPVVVAQDEVPVVRTADPLVIQVKPGTSLVLSSPFAGVIFDLFGDQFLNDTYRVSWPTSSDFGFLALPDESGDIKGIHQLFGDGTKGPDRKPAAHGFDALAKYDGLLQDGSYSLTQRNHLINKSDLIFSKLKVWVDGDHNGKATVTELKSLDQLGIASISLNFDPSYSEKDEHGNIISYKSSAVKSDGQLLNVFNLWLRYISAL